MANYEFRPEDFTDTRFQDVIKQGVAGLEKGVSLADTLMSAPIKRATNALQLETLKREFQSKYLNADQARARIRITLESLTGSTGEALYNNEDIDKAIGGLIPPNAGTDWVISIDDLKDYLSGLKSGKAGKSMPETERQNLFSLQEQWKDIKDVIGYFDADGTPAHPDSQTKLVGVLPYLIQVAGQVGGLGGAAISSLLTALRNLMPEDERFTLNEDDARFIQALSGFQNKYIRDMSGATVTDGEAARVFSALVSVGSNPPNFRSTAIQSLNRLKERINTRWTDDMRAYIPQSIPTMPSDLMQYIPVFSGLRTAASIPTQEKVKTKIQTPKPLKKKPIGNLPTMELRG